MKTRTNNRRPAGDLGPYRGPIRLNQPASDVYTTSVNLTWDQTTTSSAGGALALRVKALDVTNANDWSALANSYSEYRVVGFEVSYLPKYNQTYNATAVPGTGATATTHVANTATPTTYADVTNYDTFRPAYSGRPFKVQWRARGTEELQWISTATTNDVGAIIGYFGGLSNSVEYGRLVAVFLVEFRGRN